MKDLAVVYGILVQNGQLLAGQPTARLEVTDMKPPVHDDFNRYVQGLKRIDIAETHLGGKTSALKETSDQSPDAAHQSPAQTKHQPEPSGVDQVPTVPGTDGQSDGNDSKPQ